MSEIGETWAAYKEALGEKKEQNRIRSTDLLEEHKVPFKSLNGGNHLEVTGQAHTFDFWPTTGKFINRDTNTSGRGIFKLLKLCGR